MNRVLWLREHITGNNAFGLLRQQKNRGSGGKTPPSEKIVFVALPPKKGRPVPSAPTHGIPASIFVVLPQNVYTGKAAKKNSNSKQKGFWPATVISLATFIAVIFLVIGMLNLMISGLRLQAYTQGYVALEQTAHKPGSGPALEDAVLNEYQHALTREMVAVRDTGGGAVAVGKGIEKGMLEQILFSEELPAGDADAVNATRKVKIFNGTAKTLDRIVVQVDMISKSGHLLGTENHTVVAIAPDGAKTIELKQVPPGAELRCYVQQLKSKSLRTSLRTL